MPPSPATGEPFWRRLFSDGEFDWAFRMRVGDAASFFAPQDPTGHLLAEKATWLDQFPGRHTVLTPAGEPLVDGLWDLATSWNHVAEPADGPRDLESLARRWEPDLLLMDLATASVAGGCVCFPSSWDLHHAIGKSVHAVHDVVPRLNPRVGDKIDRFLSSLQPGKSFQRENWGLTRTADLNYHPSLRRPKLDASVTLSEIFLRVEHQLFTAVPGGVLMGIRIANCPLADLAADPAIWQTAAEKFRTMPDDVADYKSILPARSAIVREMERFQPTNP